MRSFLEYWSNTLENYTFSSAPEIVELDVAVEVAEQLALFLPMKRHKILFSVPVRRQTKVFKRTHVHLKSASLQVSNQILESNHFSFLSQFLFLYLQLNVMKF